MNLNAFYIGAKPSLFRRKLAVGLTVWDLEVNRFDKYKKKTEVILRKRERERKRADRYAHIGRRVDTHKLTDTRAR